MIYRILCFVLLSLGATFARPPIINDARIIRNFENEAGAFAESGEVPTVEVLQEGLKAPEGVPKLPEVEAPASPLDSVFVIGSVYDCGKCDRWHPSSFATAWVMSSDGILCTNYHVVNNFKGGAVAVASWDGKVYPVTKILMVDQANDIAIIKVEAEGLQPLPMAKEAAEIGTEISCLSHPRQQFFHSTFGEVARYHNKRGRRRRGAPQVAQMSITADFASGSSGGPILNEQNEVVGMVVSTFSVYSQKIGEAQKEHLQMVFKSCAPAFVIQELLAEAEESQEEDSEKEEPSEENEGQEL